MSRPGDESRASRLLALARSRPRRPVDLLLEDLRAHGALGRFADLLASGPTARLGSPEAALARGEADLAALAAAKEACKQPAREEGLRARLERLAGYFAILAAARAYHGARLTTRADAELEPILLDLAAAVPSPWSELFTRAAACAGPG